MIYRTDRRMNGCSSKCNNSNKHIFVFPSSRVKLFVLYLFSIEIRLSLSLSFFTRSHPIVSQLLLLFLSLSLSFTSLCNICGEGQVCACCMPHCLHLVIIVIVTIITNIMINIDLMLVAVLHCGNGGGEATTHIIEQNKLTSYS